jgi:hypothetical protein
MTPPAAASLDPPARDEPCARPDLRVDWASRARLACGWLSQSQDVTGTGGSAAYYAPVFGWSGAYPETTGYIIQTLWRAGTRLGETDWHRRAVVMADWLLGLQSPEGWFPGGRWNPRREGTPSVFNTAQIVFGLLETARRTERSVYWEAAERAVGWLVRTQNPNGSWSIGSYRKGWTPSYYAHVSWPMAEFWAQRRTDVLEDSIRRSLDAVLRDRLPNGAFGRWAFQQGRPAFTHTIGYTLQGLLESSRILEAWLEIGVSTAETATILMRKAETQGGLAGAYHLDWTPVNWYRCLTGNCQIASVWMRIYEETSDFRYLNAALKAVEYVAERQQIRPQNPNVHGAIAGSAPLLGAYLRGRYPNWAAKFFVDALLDIGTHLERLVSRVKACA